MIKVTFLVCDAKKESLTVIVNMKKKFKIIIIIHSTFFKIELGLKISINYKTQPCIY